MHTRDVSIGDVKAYVRSDLRNGEELTASPAVSIQIILDNAEKNAALDGRSQYGSGDLLVGLLEYIHEKDTLCVAGRILAENEIRIIL